MVPQDAPEYKRGATMKSWNVECATQLQAQEVNYVNCKGTTYL